ncbi:MAG: zinc ribbon domain-containing protein [Myxococcota bacterium]
MLCPNCGKNSPADARFCHHCGIPLSPPKQVEARDSQSVRGGLDIPSGSEEMSEAAPTLFFSRNSLQESSKTPVQGMNQAVRQDVLSFSGRARPEGVSADEARTTRPSQNPSRRHIRSPQISSRDEPLRQASLSSQCSQDTLAKTMLRVDSRLKLNSTQGASQASNSVFVRDSKAFGHGSDVEHRAWRTPSPDWRGPSEDWTQSLPPVDPAKSLGTWQWESPAKVRPGSWAHGQEAFWMLLGFVLLASLVGSAFYYWGVRRPAELSARATPLDTESAPIDALLHPSSGNGAPAVPAESEIVRPEPAEDVRRRYLAQARTQLEGLVYPCLTGTGQETRLELVLTSDGRVSEARSLPPSLSDAAPNAVSAHCAALAVSGQAIGAPPIGLSRIVLSFRR